MILKFSFNETSIDEPQQNKNKKNGNVYFFGRQRKRGGGQYLSSKGNTTLHFVFPTVKASIILYFNISIILYFYPSISKFRSLYFYDISIPPPVQRWSTLAGPQRLGVRILYIYTSISTYHTSLLLFLFFYFFTSISILLFLYILSPVLRGYLLVVDQRLGVVGQCHLSLI